jgi:hypothetical protein
LPSRNDHNLYWHHENLYHKEKLGELFTILFRAFLQEVTTTMLVDHCLGWMRYPEHLGKCPDFGAILENYAASCTKTKKPLRF